MLDLGSIDWGVMFRPEYRDMLLQGIQTTLTLTAGGVVGGLSIGALVALARLAPVRWISISATAFVECMRTIPLLVHLMFWYFAVPEALPDVIKDWLYQQDVSVYATLVAVSLYASAFISEDIRSGIRAIPKGQAEASHSLGFGFFDTFRLVILPQALHSTVPPLLGQVLTITKNTTVGLMVGATELAYVTRAVQSESFLSIGIYTFTSVFFLLIAAVLTLLSKAYQRRHAVS